MRALPASVGPVRFAFMAERLAKRLLIVGWDAADWKIIDQLFAAGRMPHLKSLVDRGVRGDLMSLDPKLSPLLWTSIATGKTADKHGVLHFLEPDPQGSGVRVTCSTSRKTKAIWNILTQAGLSTRVFGWYASHPAEPIRGEVVSNLYYEGIPKEPPTRATPWRAMAGLVHPAALSDEVGELRIHPGEIDPRELLSFVPTLMADHSRLHDPRVALLGKLVAQCASIHAIATASLELRPDDWDCAMVFYDSIDVIGHHFMQYHPPRMPHVSEADFAFFRHVMFGAYQLHDVMLGRLLELAGPETTVVLLSDHGFHSDHLRPAVPPAMDDEHAAMDATWHRPLGVLAMAGPGIQRGDGLVHGATLLDICPTALALLGVPIGADMDGRVLSEALSKAGETERVFSWDTLDGEAGQHPTELRVDPFESADAMKQLAELGYIDPGGAGGATTNAIELTRRESRFNLGVVYMTTRRVAQAVAIFEELAKERPDEPRYVMNLSQCYQHSGRLADSRRVLEEFLSRHPEFPDGTVALAIAHFMEGSLAKAGELLEKAERDRPGDVNTVCLLGFVYAWMKRDDDAQRVLQQVLAIDPHLARAHHGLGLVAINRGQYEDAAEHCLRSIELQHMNADAYYSLGVALTWLKDFERALQAFNVAVSMQPGMIDAHRYLMSIYRHQGRMDMAPRHRKIVEELMAKRKRGEEHLTDFLREPPMGPLEWAKSMGLKEDEA